MHSGERLTERYRLRSRLSAGDGGELWRAEDVVDQSLVTVGLLDGAHPALPALTEDPVTLAHGVLPADGDGPGTAYVVMPSDRDQALTALLGAAPFTRGGRARPAPAVTFKSPPPVEENPLRRAGRAILVLGAFAAAGGLALWSNQLVTHDAASPTGPSVAATVAPVLAAPPLDVGQAIGQPEQQVAADLRSQGVQVESQLEVRTDVPPGHVTALFRHGDTVVLRVATSPSSRLPGTTTSSGSAVITASGSSATPTTTTDSSTATGTSTTPPTTTDPPTTTTVPPPTTTVPPPTTTVPPPTTTDPPPTTTVPPPTTTVPPPTTTDPPPTTTVPPPTTTDPPPPTTTDPPPTTTTVPSTTTDPPPTTTVPSTTDPTTTVPTTPAV